MSGLRRSSRLARGRATQESQDHLTWLHMDVYGYVTAETAQEISVMSWLRCAQDVANLTRAKADKDALMRAREELRELHRTVFGFSKLRDAEKLEEIATYDARRVQTELATLRRMYEQRYSARQEAWEHAQRKEAQS